MNVFFLCNVVSVKEMPYVRKTLPFILCKADLCLFEKVEMVEGDDLLQKAP